MGINRAIGSIEQVGDSYISTVRRASILKDGVEEPGFSGGKAIARDFDELVSFLRKHFNVPEETRQLTMPTSEEIAEEWPKCVAETKGGRVFSLEIND